MQISQFTLYTTCFVAQLPLLIAGQILHMYIYIIHSTEVLNHASNLLITERLTHYRLKYAQSKRTYEHNLRHIESLITPQYFQKLTHLNTKKSSYTHRRHLLTHQKKFAALLSEYDTPFLSPYDTLTTFDIPAPTFHGPLLKTTTTPTPKNDNTHHLLEQHRSP